MAIQLITLEILCKNIGINLYVLNNGKLQIYDKQAKIRREIPLIIEVKNNHFVSCSR